MNKVFVVLLTLCFCLPAMSQHLIGKAKDQILKEIKTLYPGFVMDNSSVNHTYKYLKYKDRGSEQTLLVFLSDNDVCTATKLMSDFSNLEQAKGYLNKNYKAAGKNQWIYAVDGVTYLVKLKSEEWYFSVFTSKKE
jgi:hypothetical protein